MSKISSSCDLKFNMSGTCLKGAAKGKQNVICMNLCPIVAEFILIFFNQAAEKEAALEEKKKQDRKAKKGQKKEQKKQDQRNEAENPVKKSSPQKRDSTSSGYGSDEPDTKKRKVTRGWC